MDFPDPKPTPEEMVETYVKTCAKVVGGYFSLTYTSVEPVCTLRVSVWFVNEVVDW